jgi:heme-degrading monooxygenase HmoA
VLPLLYVSRLDYPPDGHDAFTGWYARRHAPDLVGAGFLSVSSFRAAEGSPWICNLYELQGLEGFGPAYQQARASDTEGAVLTTRSTNGSLAVYQQRATAGLPHPGAGPGPRWSDALVAPVVGTFRFGFDDPDALEHWYRRDELARLANLPGCISARLGRQVDAGRPNRDPRPWSVFTEWANLTTGRAWVAAAVVEQDRALGEPSDVSIHLLRRQFALYHPEAWEP